MGEDYTVFVKMDSKGQVTDFGCDCLYDFDDVCKHLVAVFLAIGAGDFKQEEAAPSQTTERSMDLQTLVTSISTTDLQTFVVEHANQSDPFKRELLLRFAEPDVQAELTQVKELLRQAIRRGTRSGMIDYRGCDRICEECMSLLDAAETRLGQGQ